MTSNDLITVTGALGTVAFAISGALTAIDRRLDLFGVLFIGCITATGGGIIRDTLLGELPPAIFSDLYLLLTAALAACIVFVTAYIFRSRYEGLRDRIEVINNVFDAIGLAAFSVAGTQVTVSSGHGENAVLAIILGVVTGVGGGVLRDVLTDSTPSVLRKHIYALASLGGSTLYYCLDRFGVKTLISTVAAMVLVFVIRMLATRFRWSLPKVKK